LTRFKPTKVLVLSRHRFSGYELAPIGIKCHAREVIDVRCRLDELADSYLAQQLLADLATERSRSALAEFHLAAGELPLPSKGSGRTALRAQDSAVTDNHASHDVHRLRHFTSEARGQLIGWVRARSVDHGRVPGVRDMIDVHRRSAGGCAGWRKSWP